MCLHEIAHVGFCSDEFLQECQGKREVLENQLQWYEISDSDAEESESESMEEEEAEVSDGYIGLPPYHINFGELPEGVFGFEQFSDDEEWVMSDADELDEEWSDEEEEAVEYVAIVDAEEDETANAAN